MRLSYHPQSRRELKKAAARYNVERSGLGDEFLAEFDAAAGIVMAHGATMGIWRQDVRVVKLKRFPYGIYYRVIGDTARVLTVRHLHRDPDLGLDRI